MERIRSREQSELPERAVGTADLLRLATAGSVDDGKSTLVGRLLYDTKSVLADQLDAVHRASVDRGLATPDLSLLVDGLRAEREQGITIDVAYRYFATPRRTFVLADTPGHVQYTRNTVTGASTAQLGVLLVDARKGVVEQTRRHAAVLALLGVPQLVLAVNKIDLVGYDESVFRVIAKEFATHAAGLGYPPDAVVAIPVSALLGDNVVDRGENTAWYDGPTLLEHLEAVPVSDDGAARTHLQPRNGATNGAANGGASWGVNASANGGASEDAHASTNGKANGDTDRDANGGIVTVDTRPQPLRFPVQYVIRPRTADRPDYRGYAGQVAAGVVRTGDEVVVLPAGLRSTVARIDTPDGSLAEASAGQSVTLLLADELDIGRGDLIATAHAAPVPTDQLTATVCWLAERPLRPRTRLLIKHGTRTVPAVVTDLLARFDEQKLSTVEYPGTLALNEIGRVSIRTAEPLPVDDYAANRRNGAFIVIDPADGSTLAAGMVGGHLPVLDDAAFR